MTMISTETTNPYRIAILNGIIFQTSYNGRQLQSDQDKNQSV